ncbi:hypothetical protein E5083_02630 [Streptomyces bauhiniae]|uniref:Uncharacterized protein n=1 Tax=Streptomyces bauhiniae TaxID=2340725 RepID=A0A4Z1DEE2_9ACTN|nr:hypothetical protein [Streptomyces bauhiniae]TGN81432.1 hypothetical protein E5083_02630 [Streptomyces bauhiniae]
MTKRLITLYAAILLPLSLAASLPLDAIQHPATALWTLTTMPSSVLMTTAWMATSPLLPTAFDPGPTASTLLTLIFHLTASALNIGALLLLRKACGRCRVLARA